MYTANGERMHFRLDPTLNKQLEYMRDGGAFRKEPMSTSSYSPQRIGPTIKCSQWYLPLACCLTTVILITVCIVIIVREVERTRADVKPLLSALTPILEDANKMSAEMRDSARLVFSMMSNVDNASHRVLPIVNRMFDAVNETANAVAHIEDIARHPVVRINLEGK